MKYTLAHVSDTHIAYEAYGSLAVSGHNQRSVDIVKAFTGNGQAIIAADPPLVVVSGDIADRPTIATRYLLVIGNWLSSVASIRPDGTRRQVVVISGNHDQPHNPTEPCFLELFRDLPGVHVITNEYRRITFGADADPVLSDTIVHAIPHDTLKHISADDVVPVPEKTNILVAHGVAGGGELYRRSLGREFPIPTDILVQDWEYGALGHYHKQGPVAVGGLSEQTTPHWYAGSTENMGFRDLLHSQGARRGHLLVTVEAKKQPVVVPVEVPIRAIMRLPVVDASALSVEELELKLLENIAGAPIAGAVVGQIVEGITRDVWALIDRSRIVKTASSALHYELAPRYVQQNLDGETSAQRRLGGIGNALEELIAERVPNDLQEPVTLYAKDLLGDALERFDGAEAGEEIEDVLDVTVAEGPQADAKVAVVHD